MSLSWRPRLGHAVLQLLLLLPGLAWADDASEAVMPPLAAASAQTLVQAQAQAQTPLLAPEGVTEVASTVPWYQHIEQAARAHGVDVHLLHAVVAVESNFNAHAVSRSGAIGLMQIMPATAAGFIGLQGSKQSLKRQLQDPAINVHAGALYLRSLLDSFSQRMDLALAAYNAGSGNVRKAGNRVPNNGQTPQFVRKVTALYASLKAAAKPADSKAPEATGFSPAQPAFVPQ